MHPGLTGRRLRSYPHVAFVPGYKKVENYLRKLEESEDRRQHESVYVVPPADVVRRGICPDQPLMPLRRPPSASALPVVQGGPRAAQH